jgi:8-oxo-dGTP pyrophosphatase MutT (NUDIX family)
MHEDIFVPDTSLTKVDEDWDVLCKQNPEYFDGDIVHVLHVNRTGCGGATLQVARSSYRFHAVGGLGMTPLGVQGICMQEGKYLCGLRGKHMGAYPKMWEFAPAGMVEPDQKPEHIIERELEEETGLMLNSPPTAVALYFDEDVSTWEIVFRLHVTGECLAGGTEYESLGWFDIKKMPSPMSPPAIQMKSLL